MPLGLDLDSELIQRNRPSATDYDEAEASDLNGQLLALVERGKRGEAIRLYGEALGCGAVEAEAAINELAKNVEFQVAVPSAARPVSNGQVRWFSRWVAAVRSKMGLNHR